MPVAGPSIATYGDTVQFRFTRQPDGLIDVEVESELPVLNDALADSVSSRAPRGATPGLSAYWIERAEEGVKRAADTGLVEPFASGNVTYLRLEGDRVIAGYDFDTRAAETDWIPLDLFLQILDEWKNLVEEERGATGQAAMPPLSGERVWKRGQGDDASH
jgi:hypothetical protein